MSETFTARNLGAKSITRNVIIDEHTTNMAKILLCCEDRVITIWDATYIYIEKSSSYDFQRATYSMHKHRSLLKFMLVVASDGFIIDVIGPFLCNGRNNDASITEEVLSESSYDISDWFERGDVFVVDRGFRDCLDYLEG